MQGYFDFMLPKEQSFFTGTFYKRRPKTTADFGISFGYDLVDDKTHDKTNLIGALETDNERITIKTVEVIDFIVKGYIVTQDGDLWQIDSKTTRVHAEDKEAYRLWKKPYRRLTTLRLVRVQNPWGLQ